MRTALFTDVGGFLDIGYPLTDEFLPHAPNKAGGRRNFSLAAQGFRC